MTSAQIQEKRIEKARIFAYMYEGKPCRAVATQCIEVGVDLDFKTVHRALAPLDAIIQAAGRCNRNGRDRMGRAIVFCPEDSRRLYPDDCYNNAAVTVQEMSPSFLFMIRIIFGSIISGCSMGVQTRKH
ncbi:MAG: hypothetical protein ACLR4Z_07675 [Butyricicoccaceae bacterium]